MNIKLIFALVLSLIMIACAKTLSEEPHLVANDSDTHGCIGSQCYLWFAKTAQCERSWEFAQYIKLSEHVFV